MQCCSACCSHAGYAILENVEQIYEWYKQGRYQRPDFVVEQGLPFHEFVFRYFDVETCEFDGWLRKRRIVIFHIKSFSSDGHPISIPWYGSYFDVRSLLFRQNPWLNRGCVFLSHGIGEWPEDDKDSSRHCLLHTNDVLQNITTKPIDCIFFTCKDEIHNCKTPTKKESRQWHVMLAKTFPGSVERFQKLLDESKAGSS